MAGLRRRLRGVEWVAWVAAIAIWLIADTILTAAPGDVTMKYVTAEPMNVASLSGLQSSTTFIFGWESAAVNNTTTLYLDFRVTAKITTETTTNQAGEIRLYLVAMLNDSTWPDVFDGTESTETVTDTEMRDAITTLCAVSQTDTGSGDVYYLDCPSVAAAFHGNLPAQFVIFITQTAQANGNRIAPSGQAVTVKASYLNVAQS